MFAFFLLGEIILISPSTRVSGMSGEAAVYVLEHTRCVTAYKCLSFK